MEREREREASKGMKNKSLNFLQCPMIKLVLEANSTLDSPLTLEKSSLFWRTTSMTKQDKCNDDICLKN